MSWHITRRLPHLVASLLFAMGMLVGGLTTSAQAASGPAQALQPLVPAGSGSPVILIHGVGDASDHLKGGCDSSTTWGPTETFLKNRGWSYVYSLGFYSADYNCGDSIYTYEQSHHHCTNYYDSGSDDGTWNDDDRHVACELAWYVWDSFTAKGIPVNFVAHSLGGVIIKYALFRSSTNPNDHNGNFPRYLSVHQVVTLASPLNGSTTFGSIPTCGECWQVKELEQGVVGGIWGELTSSDAQGTQGAGGTNWTSEGQANGALGCDHVGDSAFQGIHYGLKIDYSNPVWQNNPNLQDACQFPPLFGQWYYGHGTYLVDTATSTNVPVNYCTGCSGDPGGHANFSHSLQEMYWGIIGRCNILSSTTTCDGVDPNQTGCSSTKYPQSGDVWYLTIYWSTHCSANWALVDAPSGYLVTVTVARSPTASWSNVDRQFVYCAPSRTSCPTGTWQTFGQYTTSWYTDMLYAPSESVAVRITTSTGATYTSIWH